VIQTAVNQTWAYFSPLTRAWEPALGALVAVLAPTIARLRSVWAPQAVAFAGLAGIALAAVLFTSDTRYPGSAVTLPVVGSAVLMAAGQPTNGCWARPVGAANAVGRRPVLLHASLAFATSSSSKSAAYSIGTSSSLRQGDGIPDKPIRIQSSREQFRLDIEGMRAIAAGLVTLFHADHKPFTGDFVGVDVFFVIWLFGHKSAAHKEQKRAGRFSISGYYASSVRRILLVSTLVGLITLFATYDWLGFIAGNNVANDEGIVCRSSLLVVHRGRYHVRPEQRRKETGPREPTMSVTCPTAVCPSPSAWASLTQCSPSGHRRERLCGPTAPGGR
jgi:peptidoglycan/LPS O-acetylase OafA/YrhL